MSGSSLIVAVNALLLKRLPISDPPSNRGQSPAPVTDQPTIGPRT
jgi:hypothetical protein